MPTASLGWAFALLLMLVLGAVLGVVMLVVLFVTAWAMVGIGVRRLLLGRSRRQWRREHFDEAGQPLPPAAQGLCDRCCGAFDKVYYLPSGRRLCPRCYEEVPHA